MKDDDTSQVSTESRAPEGLDGPDGTAAGREDGGAISARAELLEGLAYYEDWRVAQEARVSAEVEAEAVGIRTKRVPMPNLYPTHVPLYANEWTHSPERMAFAAAQAADYGEIEYNARGRHPNGPMVRITERGRKALALLLEQPKVEP